MSETKTDVDLTALVSPEDPIRQRFKETCEEYRRQVHDKGKPWGGHESILQRHALFPEFRRVYYKFSVYRELTSLEPGKKLDIVGEFRKLDGIFKGAADWETYMDVCVSIYAELTGNDNLVVNQQAA